MPDPATIDDYTENISLVLRAIHLCFGIGANFFPAGRNGEPVDE